MLDTTPSGLTREARYAEERLRQGWIGTDLDEEVRAYAGPGYRQDWGSSEEDEGERENFAQQWFSMMAPVLLSGNPRVRIRSERAGPGAQRVAKALQADVNRNIVQNDMRAVNEILFYDWGHRWAVALTTLHPVPGFSDFEDRPERPATTRIPIEHYLHDSLALEDQKDRWRGHKVIRDKEDLLERARAHPEEGWNKELLEALDVDGGLERTIRGDADFQDRTTRISRQEVAYLEIWVPEHQLERAKDARGRWFRPSPENGHHGTVFTIPWGQHEDAGGWPDQAGMEERIRRSKLGGYLRRPFPWYGPPEGPYTRGGCWIVRNMTEPMGPIPAAQSQVEELNMVRNAISAAIRAYKRGIAVDGTAGDDLADMLATFEDLSVFKLSGADDIRRHLSEVQLGGPSAELFQMFEFLAQSLARNTGLDDAQQGSADPDATATAVSVAARQSGRRSGWIREKFIRFVTEVLRKEAWYLFHQSQREAISLGQIVDPMTGEQVEEPIFSTGIVVDPDQPALRFDDMELSIELYSLAMTSEEQLQAQAQGRLQFLLSVVPQLPQLSLFVDTQNFVEEYAELVGDPGLARHVDFRMAQALGALQLQMGVPPAQPQAMPEPRLALGPAQPTPLQSFGGGGGQRSQRPGGFEKPGGTQSRTVKPMGSAA